MANRFGVSVRSIYKKRQRLEKKLQRPIPISGNQRQREHPALHGNLDFNIKDGVVLVGSDAHYWPNEGVTTAHAAFVHFCEELKPKAVVMNGDILDGASISRHPAMNWEAVPDLVGELQESQIRLGEIEAAAKGARRFWPLGNHDARYEMRLANIVREYKGIQGVHLKDHFPKWSPCHKLAINPAEHQGRYFCQVVVTHNWKGGVHARRNNTLNAGVSYCTGHSHKLGVTPLRDLTGNRYGIETGTLASLGGPQFEYTRGTPVDWQPGFVVLTFYKGQMLWPEVVRVIDTGVVEFRGKVIKV